MNTLIQKANKSLLNQEPVVVFPIEVWNKIQHKIEEMQEDLEMYNSKSYKKDIACSRKSKKLYSNKEAREALGL